MHACGEIEMIGVYADGSETGYDAVGTAGHGGGNHAA